MALVKDLFSNKFLHVIYRVSWGFIYPWYSLLNFFISLFIQTTPERDAPCNERYCFIMICAPFLIVIICIFTPIMLIGLPFWIALGQVKNSYAYYECLELCNPASIQDIRQKSTQRSAPGETSVEKEANNLPAITKSIEESIEQQGKQIKKIGEDAKFTVVTANTCLLPEAIARTENLGNVKRRARNIASAIIHGDDVESDELVMVEAPVTDDSNSFNARFRRHTTLVDFVYPLSTKFPKSIDFLCLQEVFDSDASAILREILSESFGFMLHDAGCKSCVQLLNSGLFIASRYPITDADFKRFWACEGKEKFLSKGVLMAKIDLGQTSSNKKLVGYIANTHLQQFGREIRCLQMDAVLCEIELFQRATKVEDEVVLFDILCGDFNFDRMSLGEEANWKHSIFDSYCDPCVNDRGEYKPWVVGTKLITDDIHMKLISTPDGLKRTMENDGLRQYFVESVYRKKATDGMPEFNGKRKLDNILYRPPNKIDLSVEEFSFITAASTFTDHIPCSMTFTVNR